VNRKRATVLSLALALGLGAHANQADANGLGHCLERAGLTEHHTECRVFMGYGDIGDDADDIASKIADCAALQGELIWYGNVDDSFWCEMVGTQDWFGTEVVEVEIIDALVVERYGSTPAEPVAAMPKFMG
jgi:hypothetical protein